MAYSPDGKTIATGSLDRTVKLWDVAALLKAAADLPKPEPKKNPFDRYDFGPQRQSPAG